MLGPVFSIQKCVITDHPDVLMLLLKRFEFDYRHMRYVKRNNMVDIPMILQLQEVYIYRLFCYLSQHISFSIFMLIIFFLWWPESDLWTVRICGSFWESERWTLHCDNQVPEQQWREMVQLQWFQCHIGKTDHLLFRVTDPKAAALNTQFCGFVLDSEKKS